MSENDEFLQKKDLEEIKLWIKEQFVERAEIKKISQSIEKQNEELKKTAKYYQEEDSDTKKRTKENESNIIKNEKRISQFQKKVKAIFIQRTIENQEIVESLQINSRIPKIRNFISIMTSLSSILLIVLALIQLKLIKNQNIMTKYQGDLQNSIMERQYSQHYNVFLLDLIQSIYKELEDNPKEELGQNTVSTIINLSYLLKDTEVNLLSRRKISRSNEKGLLLKTILESNINEKQKSQIVKNSNFENAYITNCFIVDKKIQKIRLDSVIIGQLSFTNSRISDFQLSNSIIKTLKFDSKTTANGIQANDTKINLLKISDSDINFLQVNKLLIDSCIINRSDLNNSSFSFHKKSNLSLDVISSKIHNNDFQIEEITKLDLKNSIIKDDTIEVCKKKSKLRYLSLENSGIISASTIDMSCIEKTKVNNSVGKFHDHNELDSIIENNYKLRNYNDFDNSPVLGDFEETLSNN